MAIGLTPLEQAEARTSIRVLVRRQGVRLKAASPTAMIAALVAAACMPAIWPLIGGVPEVARAGVALLGGVGSSYISDAAKRAIERLRHKDGGSPTKAELQEALERELLASLEAQDERSEALRSEAAALLERVQAVETALAAASSDLQLALTDTFTELGDLFGEFRWMLQETRSTLEAVESEQARQGTEQRHQTDLLREFRVKINLALRRLETLTTPEPAAAVIEDSADGEELPLPPAPGVCPYKGLETFEPEDAEWFFGRVRVVADLAVRLSETRFLAVMGPSGSGKSSVLRAGLLPTLWSGKLPGDDRWMTIVMTPGAHPTAELAARMGAEAGVAAGLLLDDWRADPGRIRLALRQVLARSSGATRLLLLIDQFEEIFTLCSDEEERRCFIRGLSETVGDADVQATVVLGVRADFYARCADYPELVEIIQDSQVLIGGMDSSDLREVIMAPATQAGLKLEAGLAETMLADLGNEPGALPLLSHALFATWSVRKGRVLTLAGYRQVGGVRQAIARTAERVVDELDPAHRDVAKAIFLRLTALGEGTEDTRRRVQRRELDTADPEAVHLVLERLTNARLVTIGDDGVQVSHEALIREWPTLRRWLREDRESLRIHRRLTQAANEWEALGREPSLLYKGSQLVGAQDWLAGKQDRLNALEHAFLKASGEQRQDELAAARRRSQRLAMLSLILVITSTVTVWQTSVARRQRGVATVQRDLATARQLAVQATVIKDQPLSLLLSLESLRLDPSASEPWAPLQQGLLHPRNSVIVLRGHVGSVAEATFSPDGRTIASAGSDGTVRLWDTSTGKQIGQPLAAGGHPIRSVAFSPDGRTIASGGGDGTIRRWNTSTSKPVGQPLAGHTGSISKVVFSSDGRAIASAGSDGTVRLWDTSTGKQTGPSLEDSGSVIDSVAFSSDDKTIVSIDSKLPPSSMVRRWDRSTGRLIGTAQIDMFLGAVFSLDGQVIASAGIDNMVHLWEASTGRAIGQVPIDRDNNYLMGVALSPDGKSIASASDDGTLRLWERSTGTPISQPLTGHSGPVRRLTFSLDGLRIASAGNDGTVRVWDIATREPVGHPLTGHTGPVFKLAFSPDGRIVASAGSDGTVRLWDTSTGKPIRQLLAQEVGLSVYDVTFSPDGKMIASADGKTVEAPGNMGTVRLWDTSTGNPIGQPLVGHVGWAYSVAFSPDGRRIVSSGYDGFVRLWDVSPGKPIGQPLTGPTGSLGGPTFSPDGKIIAAVGDGKIHFLDSSTGKPIGQPLIIDGGSAGEMVFSRDGKTIASADNDGSIRLWDTATRKRIGQPLTGHSGSVNGVAFSPDGKILASAGSEGTIGVDGTVRLWDTSTGKPIGQPLTGHVGSVYAIAFSPDGKTIASGGRDGSIRLWPGDRGAWVQRTCAQVGRNLTDSEWIEYLPDRPYKSTCPNVPSLHK